MTLSDARSFALSLPETTESPHFERTSFRVGGKIYATAAPGGSEMNIFVTPESVDAAVTERPDACVKLWWGKRVVGVTVRLDRGNPEFVFELLEEAWSIRAPKRRSHTLLEVGQRKNELD